jgi:hypothetical protein
LKSQHERKKLAERSYLETFLKLNNWCHLVDDAIREEPDFLLNGPNEEVIGLEIVNLYKNEREHGSLLRMQEGRRNDDLNKIRKSYYASSGKPALVRAILPDCGLDDSCIPAVVKRIRMARPAISFEQKRFQLQVGGGLIVTLYVTALPDEVGAYDRWLCVNNTTGWRRMVSNEELSAKITKKAQRLEAYSKVAKRTILLIVVERMQDSGMFDYIRGTALLPTQGFSEVHFLMHPFESHRIA